MVDGFSADEARWVRDRLNWLGDATARNSERQSAHEATCAERYGAIVAGQNRLQTLLKWTIGSVILLMLVDLGRASLPDVLRVLLGMLH